MSTLTSKCPRDPLIRSVTLRRKRCGVVCASSDASRGRGLAQWVEEEGGKVGPVEICQTEQQGWFLRASHDIDPGTALVSLPTACLLSYGRSDDAELMSVIERVPESFWSGRLCFKLLAERLKGEKSRFQPYLHSLPLGVPGIPLFYSDTAVNALEYRPLIEQIKKRCRWLLQVPLEDRKLLSELASSSETIPEVNLLGWALAIVSSRAFRVHGEAKPASLLPLIDLCNHSFDPNCEVVSPKDRVNDVQLISSQRIPKGGALLIDYGTLSNDDLLLDYGFIVKENPYDYVQLNFSPLSFAAAKDFTSHTPSPKKERGLTGWQQRLLHKLNFTGPDAKPYVTIGRGPNLVDPRFVAGVRIMTSKTSLEDASLEHLGSLDYPLEESTELEVLRTMATMLVGALGQFSNDVHSDRTRLQSGAVSDPNEQLAVAFRVEKKQLLLDAVRHIAAKIRATKK